MALRFECPVCKHVLTARAEAAGKKARCPACSFVMVVPSASTVGEQAPVDPTDLLAMLGDRPIEAPPKEEAKPKARPPTRQGAKDDESLYRPDQEVRNEKARDREKSRGVWSVFVADCFRCIDAAVGLSSILFMVMLLLVLAGGAFAGGIFLIRATNGRSAQALLDFIATGPGQGVPVLLGILLGLYGAGYFMTYFIDSTTYKLKAMSLAPCFPGLSPGKLMLAGLKALGVMLVYIAPVVTIPLLPLGLMALAHSEDWRAFDLLWAAKAGLRRIKALAVVWAVIIVYAGVGLGVLAAVWPFLGSFLNPDSLGNIQGPVLTLVLLAVGVTLTFVVATTVGSIIGSVSGVLGWHYPDLVGSLPPRNKWAGSIVSGSIVAAVGIIVTAGTCLGRPFTFTYNLRQVTTLAWFFSDAMTETAQPNHLSPEPEKWELAWNDFFPIKAPPVPGPPVVQTPSGPPSEPVAAAAPKSEAENESPSPAPTVAPAPAPAAPPAGDVRARASKKVLTSADAYEQMVTVKAALQKYRQEHEGQNPTALAQFVSESDQPGSMLKFLPAQAGPCPPDDIVVYDSTKCNDGKSVVISQNLKVVTMPAEELRRRLQEQNSRPNGLTDRRAARAVFVHREVLGITDDVSLAQENLNNLMADLQEYADLHAGQFPASLAELRSVSTAKSEDFVNPAGKSYVYIPGQSVHSPARNVLAYDPAVYKDPLGKAVALRLQVDGQVPAKGGEELAMIRKLLDSQSPSVAGALKPVLAKPAVDVVAASQPSKPHSRLGAGNEGEAEPAVAAENAEKKDTVDWDTPDLTAVDAAKHAFFKICQATKEFKQGNFPCFGGVIIGPEATDKKDEAYLTFSKQMARKYDDLLSQSPNIHNRKDISQKLNGNEYDRAHAEEGQMYMTILRGVENGRCVCYWYHGTGDGFARFIATALGKAKMKS